MSPLCICSLFSVFSLCIWWQYLVNCYWRVTTAHTRVHVYTRRAPRCMCSRRIVRRKCSHSTCPTAQCSKTSTRATLSWPPRYSTTQLANGTRSYCMYRDVLLHGTVRLLRIYYAVGTGCITKMVIAYCVHMTL